MKHYAPPSHRVFFEVSNDTGAKARRWIDAVAVGIWPSTGHEIIGIEIKVSRGDWKRELAMPEKAQSLMRFCTRWYLACPEGLVKPDELPATWGMLIYRDDGTIKNKVQAKRLDPEPLTPGFMMAVLRNASAVDMELVSRLVADQVKEKRASFEREVERAVERRIQDVSSNQKRALEIAEKLKAITGEDLLRWGFDDQALAAAYLFMKASRVHSVQGFGPSDLPGVIDALGRAQETLTKIFNQPLFQELRAAVERAPKAGRAA
ncbi:hypothetical protein AA309_20085 [Microvirga vignae]|uniref:Uncharacterized protein n=2 Tax=Microvirga vignae TaxID=1225564 RepID=A0A0H1R8A8_9HYPH|nr:hypothetical protein AA309_20085 [Microvirga vignae]